MFLCPASFHVAVLSFLISAQEMAYLFILPGRDGASVLYSAACCAGPPSCGFEETPLDHSCLSL